MANKLAVAGLRAHQRRILLAKPIGLIVGQYCWPAEAKLSAAPAQFRGQTSCGALARISAAHSSHVCLVGMINWSVLSLHSDLNKPESNGDNAAGRADNSAHAPERQEKFLGVN